MGRDGAAVKNCALQAERATVRLVGRNQGRLERTVRVVLGIVLLGLGASGALTDSLRVACFLVSFYALVTAASGWDPLYAILRADREGH